MKIKFFILGSFLLVNACTNAPESPVQLPLPRTAQSFGANELQLDQEIYYDKVLGALVGSAIGDAMGASTEMWHRDAIQQEYGYINGLTPAIRDKSPEGTWRHNMIAGATTDDTRWKYFMGEYLSQHRGALSGNAFAAFITDYYQSIVQQLGGSATQNSTDALDERMEQIDWIKEWARVSMAYQEGGQAYHKAQNRFYGGEMSCAGMLYTPMFGLVAATPEAAYIVAYDHAIFDLGYARDISGLVAAMTQVAMRTSEMDSILQTMLYVDPYEYRNSRLIGRLSEGIAKSGGQLVHQASVMDVTDSTAVKVPPTFPGTKADWMRQQSIYQGLEKQEQAIPFHAGEIWQIMYTGLAFGEGDFRKTMAFIVNCGRDNDTVAAVAGMILGARGGYSALPEDLRVKVMQVNREILGIDLEAVAKDIVQLKD